MNNKLIFLYVPESFLVEDMHNLQCCTDVKSSRTVEISLPR